MNNKKHLEVYFQQKQVGTLAEISDHLVAFSRSFVTKKSDQSCIGKSTYKTCNCRKKWYGCVGIPTNK